MEEYKGNSNKAKEQQKALPPEKKVEKIVSGPVKSKKKNSMSPSRKTSSLKSMRTMNFDISKGVG